MDNLELATVAADPRVERVMVDRPAFATMERTGQAIGATLARSSTASRARASASRSSTPASRTTTTTSIARRAAARRAASCTSRTSPRRQPEPVVQRACSRTTTATARTSPASSPARATTPTARRKGVAPGAKLVGLKVLDGDGQRLHQRRHRGDRLRDLGQGHLQRPRHQPVGRLRRVRVVLARPADAGRPARRRRRHRRGRGRRQPRSRTATAVRSRAASRRRATRRGF